MKLTSGRARGPLRLVGLLLAGLLLASCTPGDTFDVQAVQTRDLDDSGTEYHTNRDCGFSERVSGTNSTSGAAETRDLWMFCDTGGYEADGTQFGGWWFPTNTAALVKPGPPGAVPAMPSKVLKNAAGQPLAFAGFINGGTEYPTCAGDEYAAQWLGGAVRLPDADPRRETVLVFYQNMCVRLSPLNYRFFDGGVAQSTWDADDPDAAPTATVLNDRLFAPGRFINRWWPGGLTPSGAYGGAPYFRPGTTELNVLQCGSASDCTSARWAFDPSATLAANLDRVRERGNWQYRAEGPTTSHADDTWVALPPSGDCTPTSFEGCDDDAYPPAKAVLVANSDPMTQVWGAPSAQTLGTRVILAYQPGPDAGTTMNVDHAAVRLSDDDGVFGAPNRAVLPAEHCAPASAKGCYAFVLHPDLDVDHWYYFSYFAQNDLTLPNGTVIGSLRIGRTCMKEFDGGSC